jgi:hypothetical protein
LLKLELNTNQPINQLIIQTGFHLHTIGTWDTKNRHSFLCLISWHLPQICHQLSTFYQTLWQG